MGSDSYVSLLDLRLTVAHLSVAEEALREEPYERLPYLAGSLQVARIRMESLCKEATRYRKALADIMAHMEMSASESAKASGAYSIAKIALTAPPQETPK